MREGFLFVGWSLSPDGSVAPPAFWYGRHILYAQWIKPGGMGTLYFGRYPQSKVTDELLIRKIKAYGEHPENDFYWRYQDKQYYFYKEEFYIFEAIKWNYSSNYSFDVPLSVSTDLVLDFDALGAGRHGNKDVASFEDSDLYAKINGKMATANWSKAFLESEKEHILDGALRLHNVDHPTLKEVTALSDFAKSRAKEDPFLLENEYGIPYWEETYYSFSSPGKPEYFYNTTNFWEVRESLNHRDTSERSGVVLCGELNFRQYVSRVLHFDVGNSDTEIPDIVLTKSRPEYEEKVQVPALMPVNRNDMLIFNGWSEGRNFYSKGEFEYTFAPYQYEATLTANYIEDPEAREYKVTYHYGDGGHAGYRNPETVSNKATIASQIGDPIPNDEYHVFDGWYLDAEFKNPLSKTAYATSDFDLYAKWIEYSIYDLDLVFAHLEGGGYEVSLSETSIAAGELTIPATYNDEPVKRIAANGFKGNAAITSLIMPNSIESIGQKAFMGSGIASFALSENLLSIEDYAFSNCAITEIALPSSLEYLGVGVFENCYKLLTASLPEGISKLPSKTFHNSGVFNLTLPSSLRVIEADALSNMGFMESFEIASEWTSFEHQSDLRAEDLHWRGTPTYDEQPYGFYAKRLHLYANERFPKKCTFENLQSVEVHYGMAEYLSFAGYDNLREMGLPVHFDDYSLTGEVVIEDGSKFLPYGLLSGHEITSLTLPSSVGSIRDKALEGVTGLVELHIANLSQLYSLVKSLPKTVLKLTIDKIDSDLYETLFVSKYFPVLEDLTIASNAYEGSLNLSNMSNLPLKKLYIGLPENNNCRIKFGCLSGLTQLLDLTIPHYYETASATSSTQASTAMKYWFNTSSALSLTRLTVLSGTPTAAAKETRLPSLKTLVLGEGVHGLGKMAFHGFEALESITFEGDTSTFGEMAFANTGFVSFVVPSFVTSIGDAVFEGCDKLTHISVDPSNPVYDSRNDCNCIIETATNRVVFALPGATLPEGVIDFATLDQDYYALPSSVTVLSRNSFKGARIKTLDLTQNTNIEIQEGALEGIEGLETLKLYSPVPLSTLFGSKVPSTLTTVYVAKDCVIPRNCFDASNGLKNYIQHLDLPNVRGFLNDACRGCSSLERVDAPKAYGYGSYAFKDCANLSDLNVSTILMCDHGVFNGCKKLGVLTFSVDYEFGFDWQSTGPYSQWGGDSIADGASIDGVIFESGTKSIYPLFLANATIGWMYLPSSLAQEYYTNQYGSFVDGASIGKIYYGGSVNEFNQMLNSQKNGVYCFHATTRSLLTGGEVVPYSASEQAGHWHWVDGLPALW